MTTPIRTERATELLADAFPGSVAERDDETGDLILTVEVPGACAEVLTAWTVTMDGATTTAAFEEEVERMRDLVAAVCAEALEVEE